MFSTRGTTSMNALLALAGRTLGEGQRGVGEVREMAGRTINFSSSSVGRLWGDDGEGAGSDREGFRGRPARAWVMSEELEEGVGGDELGDNLCGCG